MSNLTETLGDEGGGKAGIGNSALWAARGRLSLTEPTRYRFVSALPGFHPPTCGQGLRAPLARSNVIVTSGLLLIGVCKGFKSTAAHPVPTRWIGRV